jgi:hypothetical protein
MICGAAAVPFLVVTHLYPPWVRVKSEYQQALYWPTWTRDVEREFVGFDYVDSEAKKNKEEPKHPRSSGEAFQVTEYRIDWPKLWAERFVIVGVIAVGGYLLCGRGRK